MGTRDWNDVKSKLCSEERLNEIRHQAYEELITFSLQELRKLLKITQTELAGASGMSQPQISKLEASNDALVSTLQKYARALGGRLEINVVIDGHQPYTLGIDS